MITDDRRCGGRDVEQIAVEAVRGGVRMIQYRPDRRIVRDGEYLERARGLKKIISNVGGLLLVNDRPDIAVLSGADGVHLGAGDIPVKEAREFLGPGKIIGYSAHERDEARDAIGQGADFVTFSPVFPTTSDSNPRSPIGSESVAELIKMVDKEHPVFALGGVDHSKIEHLKSIGVTHFAVVSAITEALNIAESARQLVDFISSR